MKKTLAVAAVLSAAMPSAIAPPAQAHKGATGIVEQRMHAMKSMGKAVRALKGLMEDEEGYDADAVREQAEIIKLKAGKAMTDQFPEGSLQEPTHAKAEIWSDWERFAELANRLETLSGGLELAADNGIMMSGNGLMMDGEGHMGNGAMDQGMYQDMDQFGQMPADRLFSMMVETCSVCHREFRSRKP